ncbi:MFS transporter [Lactobacillus hominis]|uniref:Major facilitator superfamily permease n=1 Tax=Lactobacillus hominis DSM 23910 = CRBIP 24.179 TaxID=1423758 RepID=I7IVW8_9LACO|nr:MFS transporter [Lactobacillus hominis]KRM84793.1 multidrug transporter [Lactobacillus hominis DSM 23910 = CRBIP 24.179]MCT3347829.1 MFS transporter [Lactobacillus hominis]CCI82168.1 Major facilitator superfamily permease [Lactobacillus hominis DSM 23910 = CRBIP 24.179]
MNKKQITMVTFALMLGNVMAGLDGTIINTAIPAIVSALHGIQFMGWIVAIFLLGMSISIPIWTKIGEKITNKLAFEISLVLFILGSTFEGLAPNIYFFLVARLVMGIGAGGMGSLPYIIAGYVFPNIKKRTQVLGYLTASFNGAAILGPLIGGWLIDALSWHWVFYINIPIGLIAIIISLIFFKPVTPKATPVFDLLGAGLLSSGLIAFLLGIQLIGLTQGWIVTGLILLSIVLIIFFFLHEAKAKNPIIPLSVFKNRDLNGDFLLFAFTWGAFLAVNTYLPMWAQALLGLSALLGGMTLIPNSIVEIIASQTVATIQEHMRTFTLVMIGIIAMMVSVGGLFLSNLATPLWMLVIIGTFSGIGVGFIFVALQVKVQIDAGIEDMATATSTSYLIRILAQTVMAAVYGVIMNVALAQGIRKYPFISMNMMNKLSDAKSAQLLPQKLLPLMRKIFYGGIHEIMAVSFILLVIATVFNFYFNLKKPIHKN